MAPALDVLYVSYDGALDPLGTSQIVRYLLRLAANGTRISLISFEKGERRRNSLDYTAMRRTLEAAEINWLPLPYHKRPRVPATAIDVLLGAYAIRRIADHEASPAIVHCRGDVAATMARIALRRRRGKLLYDVRGFFSDERVEAGSWAEGGGLDRLVRKMEAANLAAASGLVVLTRAALRRLATKRPQLPPFHIIPTCVDLELFTPPSASAPRSYGLVYGGSLGGVTMGREIMDFARAAADVIGPTLLVTRDTADARRLAATAPWIDVITSSPNEVPKQIRRGQAAVFFYRPGPGRVAQCPTKFAEALATGLPVVTNRGIGDLDEVIEAKRVGVLIEGHSPDAYSRAVYRLACLLKDPETQQRCRHLAESHYSVEVGASRYQELYERLGKLTELKDAASNH
jgi:glycosyltransferase involved in cell wall biosynthesis